ncbi:MAG: PQQ-binding-like beta-propeller repeat protein [Thermoguttaceae bacterium]|jgi:outer membrane protein assembly factor BamB
MKTRIVRACFGSVMALSLALHAAAADLPRITHDWPMYIGPSGTFADKTKVPLLDDFSKARLVWKSEDKSIGWGKTTTGDRPHTPRAPGLYPSGQGSLIVAGGLVIAGYFIPSGEAIAKEYADNPPELRQRGLIAADDVILAVDAATGKTRWKQVFAGKGLNHGAGKHPSYGPTPAAADGRVFHIGTTGRIYCVELATGKPLWESSGGPQNIITSLVVCDQVLLVPSGGTLIGFDVASGKRLWDCANALSGSNVPSPVKVEGQQTLFCINGEGEMRLIQPNNGKVLWVQATKPRIIHFTQAVAADGKAFVWNPISSETPKKEGGAVGLGKPACYTLRLDGAKLLWELPDEHKHGMGGDGGPCGKIGYRDGVAYFGAVNFGVGGKSVFVAVNAADGKLLNTLTSPAGFGTFHLWGDKFVVVGDNSHESMAMACTYTPFTLELVPTGKPYAPRGNQGVSGYILPIRDPFVDGFQFMRTATGQIWCYDLRKSPAMFKVEAVLKDAKASDGAAIDGLLALAADADPSVRCQATLALAPRLVADRLADRKPKVLAALASLSRDADAEVLAAAAPALSTFGAEALDIVAANVKDPSVAVRQGALRTLGLLKDVKDPRVNQTLAAGLGDREPDMVLAALNATKARGADAAELAAQVAPFVDSSNAIVARKAIEALLSIGQLPSMRPKRLEAALLEMLGASDQQMAMRAVALVRALGDDEAMRIFAAVLKGNDALSGARACHGLTAIGKPAASLLPLIREAQTKWKHRVFTDASTKAVAALEQMR